MAVIFDIPMPENCVECDERAIRQLLWCKLIFSGCANCGRHPKCPLKEVPSGKWIPQTKDKQVWKCSVCGNGVCISEEYLHIHHKYCGQCGSVMKNEKETC